MHLDILKAMNEARAARRPAVLVTEIEGGAQRLVVGDPDAADMLAAPIEAATRAGKSGTVQAGGHTYFLTVQAPPVRLICIGAVHISQALAPMARQAGFDMTIIDPRTAFASAERFPDVIVMPSWPQDALPRLGLDAYTAVTLLTHDPKIDDPALAAALGADCFYIGALGSRKTHAARMARMQAQGFTDVQLARIRAPIGLDIGAVSPAEIAVSILGEMILALRKKPLRTETAIKEKAA
jgi:xanthine dehydrogenase accessory factor